MQLARKLKPILAALIGTFSSISTAGDLAAGKARAEIMCQTCHGMDGQATLPMTANITAQEKDYMVTQLQDYKSGKREHVQMSIIVQSLSDEDIENIAQWYSDIKISIEMPE